MAISLILQEIQAKLQLLSVDFASFRSVKIVFSKS